MTRTADLDRALDRALDLWGKADFTALAGDSAAAARILDHASQLSTPHPNVHPDPAARAVSHRPWWWAGGGAVAASLVAALVLGALPHSQPSRPDSQTLRTTALADDDDGDLMSFAMLYTPTSEEEYQL